MIDFEEAIATVAEAAVPSDRERVSIDEAHGRMLARDVHAMVSAPMRDVSAMDGYAVRETDLGTAPAHLRVIGARFPDSADRGMLSPGECMRVFTGAPIPDDSDRVVIQEIVRREGEMAIIEEMPGAAHHIRARGSDFANGDLILQAGRMLDYRALVAAAGADVAILDVWRQPRVVVLSTGDELTDPGIAREAEGRVPESISFGLLALVSAWGGQPVGRRRLADDLATMQRIAGNTIEDIDLVVVTGGASVGEKDFARAMFAPFGLELLFSKVAIKPGKPVWFGRTGNALVLGLPGNPTSALVTARLFLAPLVMGLAGGDPYGALRWRSTPLAVPLPPCGDRETFFRGRWNGMLVEPMIDQSSSAQKTLANSDVLIRRRPSASAAQAGEAVEVLEL